MREMREPGEQDGDEPREVRIMTVRRREEHVTSEANP